MCNTDTDKVEQQDDALIAKIKAAIDGIIDDRVLFKALAIVDRLGDLPYVVITNKQSNDVTSSFLGIRSGRLIIKQFGIYGENSSDISFNEALEFFSPELIRDGLVKLFSRRQKSIQEERTSLQTKINEANMEYEAIKEATKLLFA